jgi:hypothetical protein
MARRSTASADACLGSRLTGGAPGGCGFRGVGTVSPADRLPFEARPDLPYPRISNYRWKGVSLRRHPLAFLRADLTERRMVPCAELRRARDGRRVRAAGLVLVR